MASATQPSGEGDTRVVKESSDSGVEFEQAAESVATANVLPWRREEETIAFTINSQPFEARRAS